MANRDDQYDPYIPAGGAPARGQQGGARRPEDIQSELDAATAAMQSNVNKLSERGENLDVLQNKTDNLKDHADGFRRGANRVRKDMRWKNIKMWMWIIAGIAALILVIVLASVLTKK